MILLIVYEFTLYSLYVLSHENLEIFPLCHVEVYVLSIISPEMSHLKTQEEIRAQSLPPLHAHPQFTTANVTKLRFKKDGQ